MDEQDTLDDAVTRSLSVRMTSLVFKYRLLILR